MKLYFHVDDVTREDDLTPAELEAIRRLKISDAEYLRECARQLLEADALIHRLLERVKYLEEAASP